MKIAADYLKDARYSLKYWEKGLSEIKNGTFKYDGSMANSCVDALYKSKVEVYKEVIEYLESLEPSCVLTTDRGRTAEGCKYLKLVNK